MTPSYYEERERQLRAEADRMAAIGRTVAPYLRQSAAIDSVGTPIPGGSMNQTRMKSAFTLSPKLIGPIAAPTAVVLGTLAETGTLDRPSLKLLVVAIVGAVFGYLMGPGDVVATAPAAPAIAKPDAA
jgi:hypothetical protein